MTEADWFAATDAAPILKFLRGRASERKVRLFAAACCRHVWHLLTDPADRRAVEVAEEYADGVADPAEATTAGAARQEMLYRLNFWREFVEGGRTVTKGVSFGGLVSGRSVTWVEGQGIIAEEPVEATEVFGSDDPFDAALLVAEHAAEAAHALSADGDDDGPDIVRRQVETVRDIFGNPYRSVAFDPSWRTSTAVGLAQRMYDERDFSAMPILADALEDAGCDDVDILAHCRGEGPHVRGCFVVDLVLGKD